MATALRVRSFAKINLALAVLGRRTDGYHEIRTVFQSIDLHDELEFAESTRLELKCDDLPGVPPTQNLVWKAAETLGRLAGIDRGARITLRKNIPAGAGLGGGSSNAAATLVGLSRFWGLRAQDADLREMAADLGADVPFFLGGGTALGIGRGDELYPLPSIDTLHLVVVYPGVQVSTAEAYRSLRLLLTSKEASHKIQRFCGRLPGNQSFLAGIFNDFETSILPAYPEIGEAKRFLSDQGAKAALLSGSGSSVFGFFLDEESALAASRAMVPETWRVFPAKTLSHAEYHQRLFG
jgi:4-diphosphocytidyl-2-C-methyl-D-erythritol kinase